MIFETIQDFNSIKMLRHTIILPLAFGNSASILSTITTKNGYTFPNGRSTFKKQSEILV